MPEALSPGKRQINDAWLRIYAYYILILVAATSEFANTIQAQLIFIIFSVILVTLNNFSWLKDRKGFILAISAVIITTLHYLVNGMLVFGEIKFFLILLMVYYSVREFGRRLIEILVDCIYKLSVLSIPIYVLQLLDLDLFRALFSNFNFSFSGQREQGGIYFFVFNLNPWALDRNSGFMWEPGSFGAMMLFAIMYNVVRDNFRMGRKTIILALIAVTTFSTATYISLLLFATMMLIYRNRKKKYKLVFAIPLLVLIAIQMYDLPFIGNKLRYYYENNLDYKTTYVTNDFTGGISIGRFAGFLVEFDKMLTNPLIGVGWQSDYSDLGIGNEWSNPNGLGVILGRFGLAGIMLLFYGLYYFCPDPRVPFSTRLFVIIILLVPLFSNPFEVNIAYWAMVMFGLNHRIMEKKTQGISRNEKSSRLVTEQ